MNDAAIHTTARTPPPTTQRTKTHRAGQPAPPNAANRSGNAKHAARGTKTKGMTLLPPNAGVKRRRSRPLGRKVRRLRRRAPGRGCWPSEAPNDMQPNAGRLPALNADDLPQRHSKRCYRDEHQHRAKPTEAHEPGNWQSKRLTLSRPQNGAYARHAPRSRRCRQAWKSYKPSRVWPAAPARRVA